MDEALHNGDAGRMHIYACKEYLCMFYIKEGEFFMPAHVDDIHATGQENVPSRACQEMKQQLRLKVGLYLVEGEKGLFLRKTTERHKRVC